MDGKYKSKTCPFFLENRCRFKGDDCRFAHSRRDEVVPFPPGSSSSARLVISIPEDFVFPDERHRQRRPSATASERSLTTTVSAMTPRTGVPKTPNRPIMSRGVAECSQFPLLAKPKDPNELGTFLSDQPKRWEFSVNTLIYMLRNIDSYECIEDWVAKRPKQIVMTCLKDWKGVDPLFYAVARNCPKSVRLLISYGSNPEARHSVGPVGIPLIAYGIMHSWINLTNGTEVTRALVAAGADAHSIPSDVWTEYSKKPLLTAPAGIKRTSKDFWCTEDYRKILAKSLNLTMRYLLWLRSNQKPRKVRQSKIADREHIDALFDIPYHLIGQHHASKKFLTALWGRLCTTNHIDPDRPLTFLFAGPSGHGKTELARKLGDLLNVKHCYIDCTKLTHAADLIGAGVSYRGHESGSKLNNFLVDNSGCRSVIFMDEFCRTKPEVYNTLLDVLESGSFDDRRKVDSPVDCSQTIWVFATNHVDPQIVEFYDEFLDGKSEDERKCAPYELLRDTVMPIFRAKFANLTGRITHFVPFFPFTTSEAAVVAHKYVLQLGDCVKKDINVDGRNWRGHIHLEVSDDSRLCKKLANDSYFATGESRMSGARIIGDEVKSRLESMLNEEWFEPDTASLDEMNEGPFAQYRVEVVTLGQNREVIRVVEDGEISAPRELVK